MNFSLTNLTITRPTSMSITDLLTDYCTQIDNKIILMALFILSYWITIVVIKPISDDGIKEFFPNFYDFYIKISETVISILETFMLGGAILLISFAYIQYGFTIGQWIWIIFLGVMIILSFVYRVMNRGK